MIIGHHLDILALIILNLHPHGILVPSGTAGRDPVAVVVILRHRNGMIIQGLFLLEMEGTTVDGLTLVLLPTAGRGVGVKTRLCKKVISPRRVSICKPISS